MKLVKLINRIIYFQVLSNKFLVFRESEGNLILFENQKLSTIILDDGNSENTIFYINSDILFSHRIQNNNSFYYTLVKYSSIDGRKEILLENAFPLILNNSKLLVRIYDKDQKGIKQIDLSNNIVDWSIENDFRPKIALINSYIGLIGRDTNVLFCINSQNGEVTWSYDTKYFNSWQNYDGTDKPTQVQKILGVYEDRLYISLTSGKILVLDVITGKQLALLTNDKNKDQGYFNGHFSKALELDEKSGMLIQLFNDRYTTLNLKTNEVTESIIQEMSDQKLYNMDNFVFDDEYIYFTEKYNKKIGSFNRSTLKLDWLTSLHQENLNNIQDEPYGRQLKLHDNRLYVLDSHNILHIFEKGN